MVGNMVAVLVPGCLVTRQAARQAALLVNFLVNPQINRMLPNKEKGEPPLLQKQWTNCQQHVARVLRVAVLPDDRRF